MNKKAGDAFNTNVDSILIYANEALAISRQIKFIKGEAIAHACLGDYYSLKGDYHKSLESYDESLKVALSIHFIRGAASANIGLGMVYFTIGDPAKAMEKYFDALKMNESIHNLNGVAACYNNLALLYRNEKQNEKAIEALNSALEFYKKTSKTVSIAGAYANLGTVFQAQKDYSKALAYNKRALHIFDSLKIPRGQIISLNNLGEVHIYLDSLKLAEYEFTKALKIGKLAGYGNNSVISLKGLASVNSRKKNHLAAIDNLTTAISVAQKNKMLRDLVSLYDSLGRQYSRIGSYKEAAFVLQRSSSLKDSVYSIESMKTINNLTIKYDVEKKESEIKLLQKENKVTLLNRNIFIAIPIVVMLVIFLLYRQQVIKNHRDNQIMRQREEMMRVSYNSKITEGKLMTLRTQLNPHFIFNCLNSINSFILKSDPKSSSEILLKFAKLIRLILEKSDKKMVSFEEELKLMNLYIDLEKLRSNNLFDITLTIDSKINAQTTLVPSLIAQPFVENSILHAFTERKENNLIEIKYFFKDESLYCSIQDNGIGRQKSVKKEMSIGKEKSLGISISEQRIKLLTFDDSTEKYVSIDDLTNPLGEPIGTKVTVKIPFEINPDLVKS